MSIQLRAARAPLAGTIAVLAMWSTSSFATTINFDDGTGGASFNDPGATHAGPLTTAYTSQGVTFSGVGGNGLSGQILNPQQAGFGMTAYSGNNALVMFPGVNGVGAQTAPTERIDFTNLVSDVSIYVGTRNLGTFTLTAYDSSGNELGSDTAVFGVGSAGTYEDLMYSNTAGMISYVMVTMNNFSWMMDDLSFTPAASATPLPAALPLFATGFGAMGLFGWRRKRKGAAVAA